MTTATARAPEGLTLDNPSQAAGAVWGEHDLSSIVRVGDTRSHITHSRERVPSARHVHLHGYPTLRAGLWRARASGTMGSHYGSIEIAPEGLSLDNPSQAAGAVWGEHIRRCTCVPEGRALYPSVFEKVFFPYGNPTFHQQRPVFLCKGDMLVVLLLPFDVIHYLFFVADAIREGGIFVSPSPEMWKQWIRLEPLAGECLDSLHILCHRNGCGERYKNMHMVGHTTDSIYLTMQVVGLLHDDGIELSVVVDGDSGLATVGAENNMVKRLYVTHGEITPKRVVYCMCVESASLRDAPCRISRRSPHIALCLCGVIESTCLRHLTCYRIRGRTRCCTRNTDWTTRRLPLSRA